MYNIGFIGYGLRSTFMVRAFEQVQSDMKVCAIADPRIDELQRENAGNSTFADTVWYSSAEEMLGHSGLHGIFVGSRCYQHTEHASLVLKTGLPLFLEKPVCISEEQYSQLAEAGKGKENTVLVSFPLRFSQIVKEMRNIIQSGELGEITMVQAINNVPYGSVYYKSWYRDASLTGGLFLQKATHDVDYIRYLLGENPVSTFALASKLYYKGGKPAGLQCPECDEYRVCEESSYVRGKLYGEDVTGDACCFAVDTGNEDTASVLMKTEKGTVISYSQCFTVKKNAGRRGARFIGTRGSVEFDFYTSTIRHDSYQTNQTIYHEIKPAYPQHFGGDVGLAVAYRNLLCGHGSGANLQDGLYSAAICLSAKRSAETGLPVAIKY